MKEDTTVARSTEDAIKSVFSEMNDVLGIKNSDIPDIDLYMDQVLSFLNDKLSNNHSDSEDPALTKTMINNYTKNGLLPSPVKKKYSKEHMMVLIFIYYFKNFLSINDVQKMLNPLIETYFNNTDGLSFEDVYSEVFEVGKERIDFFKEDVMDKYEWSLSSFSSIHGEDAEMLRTFSFICYLCFDIYNKKLLVEKLIAEMNLEHMSNGQNLIAFDKKCKK